MIWIATGIKPFLTNISEITNWISSKHIFLCIILNNPKNINGIVIDIIFWTCYLREHLEYSQSYSCRV